MNEHVIVTGGYGCIGSWIAALLASEGVRVTIADVTTDDHRLRLLVEGGVLSGAARDEIGHRTADLTDADAVTAALVDATHVIHLGALQVPFCRADPRAGAAVNVGGTINVLQAALELGIEHLTYASSIAVYGPQADASTLVDDSTPFDPRTLYGGFKVANELNARTYASEHGLASIGLRPHTLYGPGRDQGLTSQPTQAISAAVAGEPFHIEYGGAMGFQFAPDVARWFIAAVRAEPDGSSVYNLGGSIASVVAFVAAISSAVPGAAVTHDDAALAFPIGCDDSALRARLGDAVDETDLVEGVAATAEVLRRASVVD